MAKLLISNDIKFFSFMRFMIILWRFDKNRLKKGRSDDGKTNIRSRFVQGMRTLR